MTALLLALRPEKLHIGESNVRWLAVSRQRRRNAAISVADSCK
jgi:hypothetical protein